MPLRQRLLSGGALIVLVLVAASFLASRAFETHLIDQVDRELAAAAQRPALGERPRPQRALSEYFIAVGRDASSLTVVESDLVAESLSPPVIDPAAIAQRAGGFPGAPAAFSVASEDGRTSWRLVALRTRNGVAVIGAPLEGVEATLIRIRRVLALAVLGALATVVTVGIWVLRLGVHPVEAMARSAAAIAGGDLSRRVPHPPETTEAGRLGAALNSMLGRIETAFRAREASEAKLRRFAADASHELRSPLTSVRGYAELHRAGGLQDPEELADAMGRIEQEATRMGTLVEDLLLLARLDEGRPPTRAAVRLDLIAHDAVRDARAVEPGRPITDDLAETTVQGDEDQLRQVVSNLLANARRHTPAGTPVTVRVSGSSSRARLEVSDAGPGLDPEQRKRVFDRFWRADASRSRTDGGAGLGLSIVQAVVQAHGGEVSVGSSPAGGASFVVELPTGDSTGAASPLPADSQAAGSS